MSTSWAAGLGETCDKAVLDVRGPAEFAGPLGHIRNAHKTRRSPEFYQLRLGYLKSLAGKPIVLVCHTDKRSAKCGLACSPKLGSATCAFLRGGMVRWNEAGLPVADRIE
jgi:rhodanese-related sulfurtransferase